MKLIENLECPSCNNPTAMAERWGMDGVIHYCAGPHSCGYYHLSKVGSVARVAETLREIQNNTPRRYATG